MKREGKNGNQLLLSHKEREKERNHRANRYTNIAKRTLMRKQYAKMEQNNFYQYAAKSQRDKPNIKLDNHKSNKNSQQFIEKSQDTFDKAGSKLVRVNSI